MEPTNQPDKFKLVQFIARYYKLLIIFPFIGACISVGVTFFIPKRYHSYGIVYPTAYNSVSKNLDNPTFGYDVEADRLIQIMHSHEVSDSLIRKFDLLAYYGISIKMRDWHHRFMKQFNRDVTFERTTSMSVLITATTEDPELSSGIVNAVIGMVDHVRSRIIKSNIEKAYESLKLQYNRQQKMVDSLEKDLIVMRDKSGASYPSLLPNSIIEFNPASNKNSTDIEIASIHFLSENRLLSEIRNEMEKARLQFEQPITGVYVVDYAIPNYHKVSPSFSTNALIAGLISLLLTIVALLIRDEIKLYRKNHQSA